MSNSATPWTAARQVPLFTEFSRQEYWSGSSFPPPGDLPNPGINPRSSTLQADSLPSEPPGYLFKTSVFNMKAIYHLKKNRTFKQAKGRNVNIVTFKL